MVEEFMISCDGLVRFLLLSACAIQLCPRLDHVYISGRQDSALAPQTGDHPWATNSRDIITVMVGSLVTKLNANKLFSDQPS